MGSGSSGYGIGRSGGGTSGSTDGGYKGGASKQRTIGDNLGALRLKYDYRSGYCGERGGSREVRHLFSDNPVTQAWDFYDTAGYGGIERQMRNGKGQTCTMRDGTVISIREVSSSDGSPAVDINIRRSTGSSGVKRQKIHFVRERRG